MSYLKIWTIYDHPKDYPEHYVARLFIVKDGKPRATQIVEIHEFLDHLRCLLPRGLTCITRDIADDPYIIESWL